MGFELKFTDQADQDLKCLEQKNRAKKILILSGRAKCNCRF